MAYFVNYFVDSFKNTGQAFIWPVRIIQLSQPWGAIALGLAFVLFPKFLKKPIERWLFDGEEPPSAESKDAKQDERHGQ